MHRRQQHASRRPPKAFRQLEYPTSPEHVHGTHVEDAWVAGQQRAADRWKGLA